MNKTSSQLLEKEGDFMGALQMYIKAGLPAKAARIAIAHPDISSQTEVIEKIASQLVKGGLYERVLSLDILIFIIYLPINEILLLIISCIDQFYITDLIFGESYGKKLFRS
jgi:hypothetical protein